MKLVLQILLPFMVLGIGVAAVVAMLAGAPKPKVAAPPPNVPNVRTVMAAPTTLTLDVHSQGTVEPHNTVALSSQVSGRVLAIAPALRAGGFFAAGEVLVTIDDADLQLALVQQEAEVARAELKLAQEQAEAAAAVRAWKQLEGERIPDALTSRALYVAEAEQALAARRAAVGRARLDLARTKVSMPFAGRVRSSDVDVGQYVVAGTPLGVVYGTDVAEVRLPIPDADTAFVDLPMARSASAAGTPAPVVDLIAEFGGTVRRWTGIVDRTEGEIDRRTRQLTIVARIADPYGPGDDPTRPPLAVGMFVEATIHGRTFADVIALPRSAVRTDGTVLVVAAENHLVARKVQVLRQDRRTVYLRGGLAGGEQVCISRIDTFVEGMPVHALAADGNDVPAAPGTPDASAQQGGR